MHGIRRFFSVPACFLLADLDAQNAPELIILDILAVTASVAVVQSSTWPGMRSLS